MRRAIIRRGDRYFIEEQNPRDGKWNPCHVDGFRDYNKAVKALGGLTRIDACVTGRRSRREVGKAGA